MAFEAVKKSSTPLIIVQQIRKNLENGDYNPGDKLPSERELCKIFSVGRSSVREAIRILVVLGYLETLHGKGTFFKLPPTTVELSFEEFETGLKEAPIVDLMEARNVLELEFVRLAAVRADNDDIERLRFLVDNMDKSQSSEEFLEFDLKFHMALAEMSNNIVLNELMKTLMNEVNKYKVYFVAGSSWTRKETIALSYEVIHHISCSEPELAAEKMQAHLALVETNWKNMRS